MYDSSIQLTLIMGGLVVASSIPATIWVHYCGRKPILLIGFSIIIPALTIFVIFVTGIEAKISIIVSKLAQDITIASLMSVFLPEILPDVALAFCFLINWIVLGIIVFLFPIIAGYTSMRYAFLIFLCFSVIGLLWVIFFVKETREKTNKEIMILYGDADITEGDTVADEISQDGETQKLTEQEIAGTAE